MSRSFNSNLTEIFDQAAQFLEGNTTTASTLNKTQENLIKYARDVAFSHMTMEKFIKLPAKKMVFQHFLDIPSFDKPYFTRQQPESQFKKFGTYTSEDLRSFNTFFSSNGGSKSTKGLSYISISELYYPMAP